VRLKKQRHLRIRKLALAVVVAMASSRLYALGLGEIELHSALSEPLNADVTLLAPQSGELDNAVVRLAPNDEFEKAGIERPAMLSNIDFNVVRNKDGSARVHITSKQPIREPFLDFIMQVSWKSGRLLREYTLLLDPPVFGEEKKVPVTAPETAASAAVNTTPTETPSPTEASTKAVMPAQPAESMTAPQASVSAGESRVQARIQHQNGTTSYGPTERNDTLWKIATNLLPDDSVSVYQMMMALLKENPQAFYDNNVNSLKAGYVLRVPEKSEVAAIDETQAERDAERQYQRWIQARHGVSTAAKSGEVSANANTGQEAQKSNVQVPEKESAHLRLVAPGDISSKSAGAGGGEQSEIDKLRSDLSIAMESSDTAKRESDELRSRVTTLEDQINSLQRLLTLKDQALNDLQERSGMTATQPPAESTTPTVEVPSVKPVPAKPATPSQPPAPKASEPTDLFSNPTLIGAVAGAALLLLSVLWLIMRRRRNGENGEPEPVEAFEEESIPQISETESVHEEHQETPFTEEFGDTQQMTDVADEVAQVAELDLPETASDLDVLHTSEGDIDPIVEADVYLAYRRYQQAEALVQGALARQPDRQDLLAKLLEIYYASKNADSFLSVAQTLYEKIGGNPENVMWQRVLPMGRELCPDHTLFGASTTPGDASEETHLVDNSSDSDVSTSSPSEQQRFEGTASSAAEESFDLNLGGEGTEGDIAQGGAEPDIAEPQESKSEFDLDLGSDAPDVASLEPEVKTPEPTHTTGQSSATGDEILADKRGVDSAEQTRDKSNSWEIEPATSDFGNIDFGLDDADLLAGTDVVGTKLDLARAYIDMGDNDSARDILNEVIEEGNDQQKQEAKGLVEKIA
jgi:pilus assembly protein FimV